MELQIAQVARELSAASNGGTDKRKQKGYHAHARYNAYGARRPSSHAQAEPAEPAPGTLTPAEPHMRDRFTRKAKNAGFPRSKQKPPVRHLNPLVTKGVPAHAGVVPSPPGGQGRVHVFPAHAGVVPPSRCLMCHRASVPRARGGGPRPPPPRRRTRQCSPRTRGWSPRASHPSACRTVFPAHAGWSPTPAPTVSAAPVFPAHAGVVPSATPSPAASCSVPRARGAGPTYNGWWPHQ